MRQLDEPYTAFHVRHTDRKSDFKSQVLKIASRIKSLVFLATDNQEVFDFFKDVFGSSKVASFCKLPSEHGRPLHYMNSDSDILQNNEDAILDLFTLCLAKRYYMFPRFSTEKNLFPSYSGFSKLAARLRQQPELLRTILPQELHRFIKYPSTLDKVQHWRWRYF